MEYGGDKTSFVQTRGSIPLFWTQSPNLKYKPKPTIDDIKDHLAAANKHIDAQLQLYGRQVLVNLVGPIIINEYPKLSELIIASLVDRSSRCRRIFGKEVRYRYYAAKQHGRPL